MNEVPMPDKVKKTSLTDFVGSLIGFPTPKGRLTPDRYHRGGKVYKTLDEAFKEQSEVDNKRFEDGIDQEADMCLNIK